MPCEALVHVKGRGKTNDGDWEPGNIVVAMPEGHKWSKEEKRFYQPIIISHLILREAMEYQGRGRTKIDLDAIHANDGDRAAMRNTKLVSPAPKNLRPTHFVKGPDWGKPLAEAAT